MRNELEIIEKIERYLKDQLSAVEKTAFEEQMAKEPGLAEEVALQREVMQGMERAILKQKVQHAGIRFRRGGNFVKWGSAGLGIILIILAVIWYNGRMGDGSQGENRWVHSDSSLPAQVYILNATQDTVIRTKGGMLLSVPANGFLDEDGQVVKGRVELVVKEALDAATIIKAGLSTWSDGRLLESGGMFFIDARKDGKNLRIDPSNALYVEVPTDDVKPGMQLFSGKRLPDGSIDWTAPRPLEHSLVPVDIQLLDFYPPHYLDSLARWGYNPANKIFTDSLYYSFASLVQEPPAQVQMEEANGVLEATKPDTVRKQARDTVIVRDSTVTPPSARSRQPACGVNPAKIKTIWSKEFQNTLLSTREFEQRLPWIHIAGVNNILDLYINNLDKDLSSIDSMAARQLSGRLKEQFLSFMARRDGKVKIGIKQLDNLRKYYERMTRATIQVIAKEQNDFWNRQAQLDNLANSNRLNHSTDSINRASLNFREEYDLNLKEAWRQLGYDTSLLNRRCRQAVYTVTVTNMGWSNLDRFVLASVYSRTTLDYTDPLSGKRANIKYRPFSIRVARSAEYDRLYVYLLADKLSSFIRVEGDKGKYGGQLNELMKYNLVCIGYKDEQAFVYLGDDIRPGEYPAVEMTAVGEKELSERLNGRGSLDQAADLRKENGFFQFEIRDQKRVRYNLALKELRNKVVKVIFPCYILAIVPE